MAELPHFGFPFHLHRGATSGDKSSHIKGKIKVEEQDTEGHVMACENVIVRCPSGFRVERPEFGIPWPEYRSTTNAEIVAALVCRRNVNIGMLFATARTAMRELEEAR